jgi:hypothetical protein
VCVRMWMTRRRGRQLLDTFLSGPTAAAQRRAPRRGRGAQGRGLVWWRRAAAWHRSRALAAALGAKVLASHTRERRRPARVRAD